MRQRRGRAKERICFALFALSAAIQGSCAGDLSGRECILIVLNTGSIVVVDSETNKAICNADLTATHANMSVKLHATEPGASTCSYTGFSAIERDLTETMGWVIKATAPGFQDTYARVTVPYDAPSCQVHDVNAVIKMMPSSH